jgi:hypothetical protein
MIPRRLLAAAILAPAILAAAPARGADPAADAQKLFDRGVDAMESKRFDQACPDIEASYNADPRPGTLFTLAECEAQRGRLATALRRYEEYLALYTTLPPDKKAKQGDREAVARRQRDALLTQAPAVMLDQPGGTVVRVDGELVPGSTGTPLRLDPGHHVLSFQVPGQEPTTQDVTLVKGERKVLTSVGGPREMRSDQPDGDRRSVPAQRVIGGVVGGLGVVGVLVATGLGAAAKGKLDSALVNCPTKKNCPMSDQAGVSSAGNLADGSTALFVVGGAAIAAGIIVWLTAPSEKPAAPVVWRVTPVVGRTGAAAVVERRF